MRVRATYDLQLDAAHYAIALLRFRRMRPDYWRVQLMPWAALLPAIATAVFASLSEPEWEVPAIALAVVSVAISIGIVIFQRRVIRKNLQRTPSFGERVQIVLEEGGARSVALDHVSHLNWDAFTQVTRFTDGFVLSQGGLNSWLPHAALSGAGIEEVERLLRSGIAAFQVR